MSKTMHEDQDGDFITVEAVAGAVVVEAQDTGGVTYQIFLFEPDAARKLAVAILSAVHKAGA